ncbi:hypothetical protein LMG26846_03476 [Achromobacter insuavis]|nr:hypothetical protein LMG26846_03476 [Achromobacter insuavis]
MDRAPHRNLSPPDPEGLRMPMRDATRGGSLPLSWAL